MAERAGGKKREEGSSSLEFGIYINLVKTVVFEMNWK